MSSGEVEQEIGGRDMQEFGKEWEAPADLEAFAEENKEFREKNPELIEKVVEMKARAMFSPKSERGVVIENGIWRMVKSFDGKPGEEAVEKLWDVFRRYGDRDATAMVKGFGFEALVLSHPLDDERVANADAALFVDDGSEDEVFQEFVHAKKLSEKLRFGRLTSPEGEDAHNYQVVTVAEARETEIENRKRLVDLKRAEEYSRLRLERGTVTEEEGKKELDKWREEIIKGVGGVKEWQTVRFTDKEIAEMRLETWGVMEKGPVVGKIIRQAFIDTNDRPHGSEPLGFGGYFDMVDKSAVESSKSLEDLGEHPFFIYLPQEDKGFKLKDKLNNLKVPYAMFDGEKWVIKNMDDPEKYHQRLVGLMGELLNKKNKELAERLTVPDGVITEKVGEGMIDNAVGVVEAKCWAKAEVEAVLTHLRPLSVEEAVSIGGKIQVGTILSHWTEAGEKPPAYISDFLNMYIEIEKEIEYLKACGASHMHKSLFAVLRVPSDVTAQQATELQLNFLRFGLKYVQVQRMPYTNNEVEAMSVALVESQFLEEKLKEEFATEGPKAKRDATLRANLNLRCRLTNVDYRYVQAVAEKLYRKKELREDDQEFYKTNKDIVDDYVALETRKNSGQSKKKKDK